MSTQTFTGVLTILNCASCGMTFGITSDFERRRRDDGAKFYCPNGHVNVWRKSELDKAREEKENVERALIRERAHADQLRASRDAYKNSARALKGVVTKTKKRAAAGVCPVAGCKRHFANVEAHIKRQHPDYGEAVS